jgi:hypothetical protein
MSTPAHGRLIEVGAVLFAIGILLLAYMLLRIIKRIRYRDTGNILNPPPKSPGLLILLPALLFILAAQGFFWLSSQLEYYRPMREDGFIGWVRAEPQANPVNSLKMTYTPMLGDSMGMPSIIYLAGDSWRLSGEILNFKFAAKYLKVPQRAYKVIRFNSRFVGRATANVSGALFTEGLLEGGATKAASVFQTGKFWDWFAVSDSFQSEYNPAEKAGEFAVRVRPDKSVVLVPREHVSKDIDISEEAEEVTEADSL